MGLFLATFLYEKELRATPKLITLDISSDIIEYDRKKLKHPNIRRSIESIRFINLSTLRTVFFQIAIHCKRILSFGALIELLPIYSGYRRLP